MIQRFLNKTKYDCCIQKNINCDSIESSNIKPRQKQKQICFRAMHKWIINGYTIQYDSVEVGCYPTKIQLRLVKLQFNYSRGQLMFNSMTVEVGKC